MPTLIKDWHENPEAPLVTVRTSPWHRGRSVIMGDAAHAIVPFYGQGMNSGFEDCFEMNKILDETQDNWDQALELFSQQRVANGHAIADLAIQNFIEMRDSVADEEFLRRKKISKHLVEIYKGKYRPQYDLVTFTQVPYKDALAFGAIQNKILDEITAISNVDARLAEGEKIKEVDQILEQFL
jgi:kynurenine 3-monooxygenase